MASGIFGSLALFILGGSLLGSCGGNSGDTGASGTSNSSVIDTAGSPANEPEKFYTFRGLPTKIDTATGMIMMAHEEIPGFMPAMTMSFEVADRALLQQVTVGRSSRFTIRKAGWEMAITKVEEDTTGYKP